MKAPFWSVLLAVTLAPSLWAATGSTIEGTVKSKEDGTPIAGATVRLHLIGPEPHHWSTETDSRGRFRFRREDSLPGVSRFFVSCEKSGYVPHRPYYYYGESGQAPTMTPRLPAALYPDAESMERILGIFSLQQGRVTRLTLELETGGSLTGRLTVRTPSGTTPLRDMLILQKSRDPISESFLTKPLLSVALVYPNDQGEFRVDGLPSSSGYELRPVVIGYGSVPTVSPIAVRKGETTHVEQVLDMADPTGMVGSLLVDGRPATTLSGHVLVRGLSFASVCVSKIREGSYSCLGLTPGMYTVQVRAYDEAQRNRDYEGEATVHVHSGSTVHADIPLRHTPPTTE